MHPNHPWNVWSTIVRWKKVLIGLSFFSALIALIFSLPWMITPKYKSVVIMFPVSTSSLASSMLSELAWSDEDLLEFGEKEQADNLIQVLESDHIRQQIVQRFHLMEHYRIDPGDPYPMTELKRAYKRNISARRTEFNAVRLTVLDTDPALAMEIANKITGLLDSTFHRMQRQRAERAVKSPWMPIRDRWPISASWKTP